MFHVVKLKCIFKYHITIQFYAHLKLHFILYFCSFLSKNLKILPTKCTIFYDYKLKFFTTIFMTIFTTIFMTKNKHFLFYRYTPWLKFYQSNCNSPLNKRCIPHFSFQKFKKFTNHIYHLL